MKNLQKRRNKKDLEEDTCLADECQEKVLHFRQQAAGPELQAAQEGQ